MSFGEICIPARDLYGDTVIVPVKFNCTMQLVTANVRSVVESAILIRAPRTISVNTATKAAYTKWHGSDRHTLSFLLLRKILDYSC